MSDQFYFKKSLFVMFSGLFLGVSAGLVGEQKSRLGSENRGLLGMSRLGQMFKKPGFGSGGPGRRGIQRTKLNNIFASSTKQNIRAENYNFANVKADDINGIIVMQQNGPVSIQNSQKKFKSANAAIDVDVKQAPYYKTAEKPMENTLSGGPRPASEKTQINNVDLSKTKQKIDTYNVNDATIKADDINGFVFISQNGPVSIQNSEQKFKSANLAANLQFTDSFGHK